MGVWNIECYHALANAIITSAASDYMNAYKILLMNPNNREAEIRYNDCRRFFLSRWYGKLTTFDGEAMMELIEKQVNEGERKQIHRPGTRAK